jgi:putative transposase
MEPCQLDGWSTTLIAGQYLSIGYTERQAEAGTVTSIGSRGDSYGNALAESTIGLSKTELIRRRGP